MGEFTMRKYQKETDFEAVYEKHCDECFKTTAYQLHGVTPCPEKEKFESIVNRAAERGLRMIWMKRGSFWDTAASDRFTGWAGTGRCFSPFGNSRRR